MSPPTHAFTLASARAWSRVARRAISAGTSMPPTIGQAIGNPLTCPVLNLNTETHRIKVLFSGIWSAANKAVNFQVFDAGKLLSNRWTLIGLPIHAGDTYQRLEEPGLMLQDKLTAHYHNGTLYFSSYHNTKRFLDLADYYREATDTDLEAFAATDLFALEDEAGFKGQADSIIRKKIALLQKNEVLKDITVTEIKTVANNFNAELPEEHHINITVKDDGKLVIPEDKKTKRAYPLSGRRICHRTPDQTQMPDQLKTIPVRR